MKIKILMLILATTGVIALRAENCPVCDHSNPCGGNCYVYIPCNGQLKGPGDCVNALDPNQNHEQYPCDCHIASS